MSDEKRPVNPAYEEAKKYKGEGEHRPRFVAFMSSFWKKVGLPNYKTIIGSSFAWCAVFIVAMNSEVGQKYLASAGARQQRKYGVEVNWKANGIPRGAVVYIDHQFNCDGKGSHVGFADGDCAVQDLMKPGATLPLMGGNQANMVKRSVYSVKEVCAVRWPEEIPLPPPVKVSVDCGGKVGQKESTR